MQSGNQFSQKIKASNFTLKYFDRITSYDEIFEPYWIKLNPNLFLIEQIQMIALTIQRRLISNSCDYKIYLPHTQILSKLFGRVYELIKPPLLHYFQTTGELNNCYHMTICRLQG